MERKSVSRGRRILLFILSWILSSTLSANAQVVPNRFVVEGRLYDNAGNPLNPAAPVSIKLELIGQTASSAPCVLYREVHSSVNISSASNVSARGVFALALGSGTQQYSAGSFPSLFTTTSINGEGACLTANNDRLVRISVDSGSGYETLSPDTRLTSVPMAMVAGTAVDANALGGFSASDYLKMNVTTSLNQTNLETVFSSTNYTKLTALLNGSSTQYLTTNPSSSLFFNDQRLTNVAAPTLTTDAATKGYADTYIGGKSINLTGIGPALGDGKVLMWDATAGQWVTGSPSMTDNTKLPLAGGTMTGPLTLGGYDLAATGNVSINSGRTLQLGTFTNASEPMSLSAGDKGKTWYNTDTNSVRFWDGSSIRTQAYLDGSGKLDPSWLPSLPSIDGGALTNVNAIRLRGFGIAGIAPNTNEVLKWNGSAWAPAADLGMTSLAGDVTGSGSGAVSVTIANNAITSAKINNSGNFVNRLLITDSTSGATVTYAACSTDEILKWSPTGWQCTTVASLAPVTSIAGKTGNVTLNINDVDGWGSATLRNVGTAPGNLVELDGSGKIDVSLLPATVGDITRVIAGTGLTGGGVTGDVSIAVDIGTTSGKIVALDGSARLPNVDGGQLSNINAARLQSRAIASTAPSSGDVLRFNTSTSTWEPAALPSAPVTSVAGRTGDVTLSVSDISGAGDITDVMAGAGLSGGGSSGAVTLSVNVGTGANQIIALDAAAKLPTVDGSQLTNVKAARLQGTSVSTATPNGSDVLKYNGSISRWEPGSIQSLLGGEAVVQGGNSFGTEAYLGTNDAYKLNLETNGSTRLTIDGSATKVGIDNTSPSYTLHVGYSAGSVAQVAQFEGVAVFRQNSSGSPSGLILKNVNGSDTGTAVEFRGTSTSVDKLAGRISASQISGNGRLALEVAQSNTAYERLVILNNGNVGIGSADPQSKLDLNGTLRAQEICDETGSNCKTISSGWGTGGSVTYVGVGTGLLGSSISTSGTISVDVGTTANKIVQLDGSSRLPGVDGGQLTNLNAARIQSRAVVSTAPVAGDVLRFNSTISAWEPRQLAVADVSGAGDITAVINGTGLTGGGSVGQITLDVNVGTGANQIVQLDGSSRLPGVDGGQLTNLNADRLRGRNLSANAPSGGSVLRFNSNISTWEPYTLTNADIGGAVTGVFAGTGLTSSGSTGNVTLSVGFPLTASAGSASAPTYSFTGDTDTGWYSPSAGVLAAATDQTERLRIDSAGNVGVGTTNPSASLTIFRTTLPAVQLLSSASGTTSFDGSALSLQGLNLKIWNQEIADIFFGTDNLERVRITAGGSVGIGTNSPRAGLDINFTGTTSALIVPRDTTANRPLSGFQVNGMIRYNTTNNKFEAYENGAWVNMISIPSQWTGSTDISYTSGNVGIGTATPGRRLHVEGGMRLAPVPISALTPTNAGDLAVDASDSNRLKYHNGSAWVDLTYSGPWADTGTDISYNLGNVGIGTTNANSKLSVFQNVNSDLNVNFVNPQPGRKTSLNLFGSGSDVALSFTGASQTWTMGQIGSTQFAIANTSTVMTPFSISNTAPNNSFVISNAGKVGIGTPNPGNGILDLVNTGTLSALIVPRATTINRPTGSNGMIRYNTDFNRFEVYENANWKTITRDTASVVTPTAVNISLANNGTMFSYSGGGPGTFNLPTLSSAPEGFQITVSRQVPQSLTLVTAGGDQFKDGNTSIEIRSRNWISVTITKISNAWVVTNHADDCTIGQSCWGAGNIYVGLFNGKQYFTTQGGCTDLPSVTCSNALDSLQKFWAQTGTESTTSVNSPNSFSDGQAQSNALAGATNVQGIYYCKNISVAGYSDWYLPARDEMLLILRALGSTYGLQTTTSAGVGYLTSTEGSTGGSFIYVTPLDAVAKSAAKNVQAHYVRCIRRF